MGLAIASSAPGVVLTSFPNLAVSLLKFFADLLLLLPSLSLLPSEHTVAIALRQDDSGPKQAVPW